MFSLEFPLIDGQNDTIGNWNFTLEKFFHNTSIIYQIFTVTINIIGSSSYTNGKFLSSNILQSIFNFLSAIFEVTERERERGNVKACEFLRNERRSICKDHRGEDTSSDPEMSPLCDETIHFSPQTWRLAFWTRLLIAQPRAARVSESDVYLIANWPPRLWSLALAGDHRHPRL